MGDQLLLALAARLQGHKIMVAGVQPVHGDQRAQRVSSHFVRLAKGISGPLDNQGRCFDSPKVIDTRFIRFARRMKRITETDRSLRPQLIGKHARHTPSHGLTRNVHRTFALEVGFTEGIE